VEVKRELKPKPSPARPLPQPLYASSFTSGVPMFLAEPKGLVLRVPNNILGGPVADIAFRNIVFHVRRLPDLTHRSGHHLREATEYSYPVLDIVNI